MFSSDAKLFVKRRLQFHFSHAENVSSKLPKWTLFHLHLRVFNYSSTRYASRRICFVSCLYISTYLKMFLVRFINRLAASHAVLPWFGGFFFPPVGALIRNIWLALKSAEVRSTGADDDRIVSHDAPRFMLYYHCVRDTLWSVTFSTREVNIDRSARCGWFPNMFRFSSFCFWDYRVG